MNPRLSRPKLHRLAAVVVEALERDPDVKLRLEAQELRWKVFTWIQQILKVDEAIDRRVRERLARSKPRLPEGSSEWQILYRQYYDEELQGLGKYRR